MVKFFLIASFALYSIAADAQTGSSNIGESVIGKDSLYSYTVGGSNTPKCQYPSLCTGGLPVYIFNGKGNWDDANNWKDFVVPPLLLPAGFEIIIDPQRNGECLLNIPLQRIAPEGKLTILSFKKFRVAGNIITK